MRLPVLSLAILVLAVFAGGLMLSVLTFTAVTLLIGDPSRSGCCGSVAALRPGSPLNPGKVRLRTRHDRHRTDFQVRPRKP